MKKLIYLFIFAIIFLGGCTTTSRVAQNISLGMTTQEVVIAAGKPFTKNINKDEEGNTVEKWFYKETTWDDGGWTWDRTIVNSVVTLKNGKVESFLKDGDDRYKTKNPFSSSVNVDRNL